MATHRDPLAGRIPVTLVTGFLGSGKTTLIARLVRHADMNRVAVVINEVGEIGIDHDLVSMSSENVSLLANGCICCSVRTDLQETLRLLFAQRRNGEIPDFDRVIVETTGLADPAPVIQTLATDTLLAAQFRLDGVVTLVDACNGGNQLEAFPEAVKQIALADRIFVTKSDLASAATIGRLHEAIASINPDCRVGFIAHGEIDPSNLTGLGLASTNDDAATLRFLGEATSDGQRSNESAGGRYLGDLRLAHARGIVTHAVHFDSPFTWSAFSSAIELLTSLRGPDLLRVKGIVNVDGKPVVVQGVQHIFHAPVELARWPGDDRRTRLVFITRNIKPELIRALFVAVESIATCPPP